MNTVSKGFKAKKFMDCWKKTTKCIIYANNCWHCRYKWLLLFYCYS